MSRKKFFFSSLLAVLGILLVIFFVIVLPIYKNAQLTPEQRITVALEEIKKENYSLAKSHLKHLENNSQALYLLGKMELEGRNMQKKADPQKASLYFERSALLGNASAQYALALLYDRGDGIKEDKEIALKWMSKSAQQQNPDAMYALAVWFERGYDKKEHSFQEIHHLYEQSAQKGQINAVKTLINLYSAEKSLFNDKIIYWKKQLEIMKKLKGKE